MFCSLETSAWDGVPLYNSGQMIGTRDESYTMGSSIKWPFHPASV